MEIICVPQRLLTVYIIQKKRLHWIISYISRSISKLSKQPIPPSWEQLLMSISLMVILFKRLDKNTIVLSVTNPPTLPVCLAILRSVKANFWLLAHDVFPDNATAHSYWCIRFSIFTSGF